MPVPFIFDTSLLQLRDAAGFIPSSVKQDFFTRFSEYEIIYTDGSKVTGYCGCAVIHLNFEIRYPLPSSFSVLSAELYAIFLALDIALRDLTGKVLICTDSLSAIRSTQNTAKYQHSFARLINNFAHDAKREFVIAWVPAHMDFGLNNIADRAAGEAAIIEPGRTRFNSKNSRIQIY